MSSKNTWICASFIPGIRILSSDRSFVHFRSQSLFIKFKNAKIVFWEILITSVMYFSLTVSSSNIFWGITATWAASWQNQQNQCAPSEDSDQPGHPPSLIRVFAVRMKKPWVLIYPLSAQRRLWFCLGSEQQRCWSDCTDVQADLGLCCICIGYKLDRFAHDEAQFKYHSNCHSDLIIIMTSKKVQVLVKSGYISINQCISINYAIQVGSYSLL